LSARVEVSVTNGLVPKVEPSHLNQRSS